MSDNENFYGLGYTTPEQLEEIREKEQILNEPRKYRGARFADEEQRTDATPTAGDIDKLPPKEKARHLKGIRDLMAELRAAAVGETVVTEPVQLELPIEEQSDQE